MNAKEAKLTHDYLVEALDYNEGTGEFIWKTNRANNRTKKGDLAGCIGNHGYRLITINGSLYRAHRLAWFYMTGEWPYPTIDHIDRDKLNNRFDNLRVCTFSEQQENTVVYKGGITVDRQDPEYKAYKRAYDRERALL